MKTDFSKEYLLQNKGCYDKKKVLEILQEKNNITLVDLLERVPVKDFNWFMMKKCNLTVLEKKRYAIGCAESVQDFYLKKFPDDKRITECNRVTRFFLDGKSSREDLLRAANAATAAANAAYAAYAANAAYAAAYAAYAAYATAADAADATAATAADAAAAYAAAYAAYSSLKTFIKSFINETHTK